MAQQPSNSSLVHLRKIETFVGKFLVAQNTNFEVPCCANSRNRSHVTDGIIVGAGPSLQLYYPLIVKYTDYAASLAKSVTE